MTINENLTEFAGRRVVDFEPGQALASPDTTAYRLRIDYDAHDKGVRITDRLAELIADPGAGKLHALVIGAWNFDSSESSEEIVEMIAASAASLGGLRALFLGDIIGEEQEISWIQQSDISPLFLAFPKLEVLRVRGGEGLAVGHIRHAELRELAFEAGGLANRVIAAVAAADLPRVERLELWLGDDNYGYEGALDVLPPLVSGERFPALRSLGIKNCQDQDAIAELVATAPIVDRLEVLDLSMGNLSDRGARALIAGGKLRSLEKLDIHHHFVSEEVVAELKRAVASLDASDPQEADQDGDDAYRFIAVSE